MPTMWQDADEHENSEADVSIRITVPEEFIGMAIDELGAHRGFVVGMEAANGVQVIRGSLPLSEFERLAMSVSTGTQGRGKLETDAA